jgi:hypothetical protein
MTTTNKKEEKALGFKEGIRCVLTQITNSKMFQHGKIGSIALKDRENRKMPSKELH